MKMTVWISVIVELNSAEVVELAFWAASAALARPLIDFFNRSSSTLLTEQMVMAGKGMSATWNEVDSTDMYTGEFSHFANNCSVK